MAITAPRWRAHGDENGVGIGNGSGQIGGKMQAAGGDITGNKVFKAWFVNRHGAILDKIDFCRIIINTCHIEPEFGKACARYKADISCSYYRNLQYHLHTKIIRR